MILGRWRDTLPGRDRLAEELGCSNSTVEEAMQRLSREGLLVSQGAGKRRRIVLPEGVKSNRAMRVSLLLYEQSDRKTYYLLAMISRLRDAGHDANFADKTMHDLGMNAKRIARYVEASDSDAWVVVGGSRDVLEWFAERPTPAFALFGRLTDVPLASTSPRKAGAVQELVDRLAGMGHRRIVMLAREERRKPSPGYLEQLYLKRLGENHIKTSAYNLPEWGDGPEELGRVLDSLFLHTPPTAIILGQPSLYFSAANHLARLGITAPEKVSLACTDDNPLFDWCRPAITHISWDSPPLIKRVVKWVENISRGKDDRRKTANEARLIIGGTIGPAPR